MKVHLTNKTTSPERDYLSLILSVAKQAGLDFDNYETVNTGLTNSLKVVLAKNGERRYFAKTGEKVEAECLMYDQPVFNSQIFLRKETEDQKVLIVPYINRPTLEELYLRSKDKLIDQNKILKNILEIVWHNFWSKTASIKTNDNEKNSAYIKSHFSSLLNEIDSVSIDNQEIAFSDLINKKIIYNKNQIVHELPSIGEMIQNIILLFNNHESCVKAFIHGDFQPSNILLGENELKIVDISNADPDGYLALDIAKYFNFFNRFYRVVLSRDEKYSSLEAGSQFPLEFRLENDYLVLNNSQPASFDQGVIEKIEEEFCLFIAKHFDDYYFIDQVKILKFILNVITMRRHLLTKSSLVDLLILNIVDSFSEVRNKALVI